jgi:cytochrome P450
MTTTVPPAGCPAHVPGDRVRVFDYAVDPLEDGSPVDGYLKFRGEAPFWSPVAGGFWVLTDQESIRACLQDADTFSNRNIGLGYDGRPGLVMIPEQLDPPEHTKYRRLLSPHFTPGAAARLEPEVRRIVVAEIDRFVEDGACDFVEQFAGRFPQIVFLQHILNFPVEEMETFLEWERDMMHHPRDVAAAEQAAQSLLGFLRRTIAERAARPMADDLITSLLAASVDGRPMTEEEVLSIAYLLFLAGLDTVTAALSFGFHLLAREPALRREIVDDPALAPAAVEELLRYHSFVSPIRTATRDVEFHGVTMRTGDRILPASALAARDPNEFPDPDVVDFHRAANRHIAFGAGPHRCLGSNLARVEFKVALEEWHRRIPRYELDPSGEVRFHAAGVLGVDTLPLRWPAS